MQTFDITATHQDYLKAIYLLESQGKEATNSALKTAHGLAKVWTRGKPRMQFAVLMKTLALNVKRYARVKCAQLATVPG